ncbi:MAG TPA: sulfatase [Thermoleophilaceae bacterium]|nr:sulfatase [Thermoleophilaceae bacterium]
MRSSSRLAVLALTLMALLVPAAAHAKPNIVFIMTDDQTVGSTAVQRNVGLIKGQGTTFTETIASYPLCCPSRATYLSGQYSHNHGVIHNAGPFGGYIHFDHSNALPIWLQQAGYRTMHVGRYLNGYGVQNPNMAEVPPGWNDWVSGVGEQVFNYERWQTNENGQIFNRPGPDHPNEHQTDFYGRRAAELIDQAAPSTQPFFLSLTFPAPHSGFPLEPDDPPFLPTPYPAPRHRNAFAGTPLPRPPNFDEADVSRKPQIVSDRPRLSPEWVAAIQENYQQELESLLSVDDAVGGVVNALERSGELDDTLLIYTSDNGFFHGEHRLASEKILPYDEAARIPLIMRGPGVPSGVELDNLVSNIDWAPTIVDAASARAGRLMDGTSLFETLDDPHRVPGREIVLENGTGANGIPMFRALRNERYLWIDHKFSGEYELYDLLKDPYQLRNLEDLDSYSEIRAAMATRLRRLQRCRGERACGASRPKLSFVARQEQPPPPARRRPQRRGEARSAASCVDRDVRLGIAGRELGDVIRVDYYRGDRKLRSTRRTPFSARVRRRALPRGRKLTLRALVTTVDGRKATYDRGVRTCRR